MVAVVDASCLAKLVVEEPGSAEFTAWFGAEVRASGRVEAPSVVRYELGRILQRDLAGEKAGVLAALHEATLRHVLLSDPPARQVFKVAARGLTFADAAYVALALQRGGGLVTTDDDMRAVARNLRIRVRAF